MADDIVQTIKVEVEGGDEAAATLEKVGESASTSFEETAKAAETAGVSIEEFGKLSEKTQQAYVELSQRVSEGSKQIVESTGELGGGLDEVTKKSGLSRGEMRALGSVMKQLGVGEVAGLAMQFNKMLGTFGAVGVAVLAAAMAFGTLMKSITEAKEASESIERLSRVLKDTPEQLQKMQSAFRAAGVSIKDFEKAFESLGIKVVERSADIGEAAAESRKKVIDAQLAAVKAAQAISTTPGMFDQQIKLLEISQKQEAAYVANEKSANAYANSLDVLVPLLEQAAQGQKTQLDASVKTESLQSGILQMFAKSRNQFDFVSQSGKVVASVLDTGSESLGSFVEDLKNGAPRAEEMADKLNVMFNSFGPAAQAKMKAALKGLEIPDPVINKITKTREQFVKLSQVPKLSLVSPEAQTALVSFGENIDEVKSQLTGFAGASIAGIRNMDAAIRGAGKSTRAFFGDFGARLVTAMDTSIGQIKQLITDWVTTPVANAWQWIKDAWAGIGTSVGETLTAAEALITAWVTTPVANAWQWITDTFKAAVDGLGSAVSGAAASIIAFVTTPVANAWQWIKDSFQATLDWLAEKWAAIKSSLSLGGGSPAPAAAGGQFAGGGLLGGRGSGTSDSNLAWVSRGEYITPARAVAQPGVLAFLEALRRSGGNLRDVLDGMGRFALGGMIRVPLTIPAFAGGGMSHAVTIQFPGLPEITGLRASSGALDELRKAAAMAQVRSGGRKPSRYS